MPGIDGIEASRRIKAHRTISRIAARIECADCCARCAVTSSFAAMSLVIAPSESETVAIRTSSQCVVPSLRRLITSPCHSLPDRMVSHSSLKTSRNGVPI